MRDGDAGQHPRRTQVEPGRLLRLLSCVVLVCGAEVAALADFSGTGRTLGSRVRGAAELRGARRRRARRGQGLAGAISPRDAPGEPATARAGAAGSRPERRAEPRNPLSAPRSVTPPRGRVPGLHPGERRSDVP